MHLLRYACAFAKTAQLWHGGPVQAYLSPIPSSTDITKYDGSGEWVKIYTLGYDLDALKAGKQMWKALLLSTGVCPSYSLTIDYFTYLSLQASHSGQ